MKKSISLLLLSLLMIAPSCQKPKEITNEYNIIPQPNQLVPKEGRFELNKQVRLETVVSNRFRTVLKLSTQASVRSM